MIDSSLLRCCIATAVAPMIVVGTAIPGAFAGAKKRAGDLPGDLVYLETVAPDIRQDIRYATSRNFTGAPLPGYLRGACVLRRPAALALRRVQADLGRRRPPLSLKTLDCYRPQRAVRAMVRWSRRPTERAQKQFYFPRIPKSQLFARQYISARSSHARGDTVDLTLVYRSLSEAKPVAAAASGTGSCIDGGRDAADPLALDMGTAFDCFDVRSHTRNGWVTKQQARNRRILVDAMARHGFRNYRREWWHFTYTGLGSRRSFDVPIR